MTTSAHSPADEAADVVALDVLAEQLLIEAAASPAGRAARTVAALPGLRTTLIALTAGQELAEHQAPGAALLTCLAGRVRLATTEREWSLHRHTLVPIPPERHRLVADAPAVVMLTVRLD
ncbi:LuxR family transcriptional regulator [Streptomyces caeni]|uniref:LuxR family transcriptional regulator n=1 Tax=Streptomyces caeni TaxID=2307231 RepID=A0ABW4IMT4_9ACTN